MPVYVNERNRTELNFEKRLGQHSSLTTPPLWLSAERNHRSSAFCQSAIRDVTVSVGRKPWPLSALSYLYLAHSRRRMLSGAAGRGATLYFFSCFKLRPKTDGHI